MNETLAVISMHRYQDMSFLHPAFQCGIALWKNFRDVLWYGKRRILDFCHNGLHLDERTGGTNFTSPVSMEICHCECITQGIFPNRNWFIIFCGFEVSYRDSESD